MKAPELCGMYSKLLLVLLAFTLASCGNDREQTETSPQLGDTTLQAPNPNLLGNGLHVIEGTILNSPLRRVILQEVIPPADPQMPPTVNVLGNADLDGEGNFRLEVQLVEPMLATLLVDQAHATELVLQGGETILLADYTNWAVADIANDANSKELQGFLSRFTLLSAQFQETQQKLRTGLRDPATEDRLESLVDEIEMLVKSYMDSTSCTGCAMYASRVLDPSQNFEHLSAFRNELATAWPGSHYLNELDSKLAPLSKWISQLAPDFTLPNANGQRVSLSSARGKYVLLDFWASWCGPCRVENPNIVQQYLKYKDKGFTVFSVSLDGVPQQRSPREEWLAAVKQDNLTWEYHVSDLKGWQSEVAAMYDIVGIPKSFLLDREGRIIAMDLRGKGLQQKLSDVFGS